MPCDSITTTTLSARLANALPDVLRKALEAEGYQIDSTSDARHIWAYKYGADSIVWTKGEGLTVSGRSRAGNDRAIDAVNKAYGRSAVAYAARRAGWTVQQTSPERLTVARR